MVSFRKLKMEDVRKGDFIFENGGYSGSLEIEVLTDPECTPCPGQTYDQWTFKGRTARGIIHFLTTPESAYGLDLSWQPHYFPVTNCDGRRVAGLETDQVGQDQ